MISFPKENGEEHLEIIRVEKDAPVEISITVSSGEEIYINSYDGHGIYRNGKRLLTKVNFSFLENAKIEDVIEAIPLEYYLTKRMNKALKVRFTWELLIENGNLYTKDLILQSLSRVETKESNAYGKLRGLLMDYHKHFINSYNSHYKGNLQPKQQTDLLKQVSDTTAKLNSLINKLYNNQAAHKRFLDSLPITLKKEKHNNKNTYDNINKLLTVGNAGEDFCYLPIENLSKLFEVIHDTASCAVFNTQEQKMNKSSVLFDWVKKMYGFWQGHIITDFSIPENINGNYYTIAFSVLRQLIEPIEKDLNIKITDSQMVTAMKEVVNYSNKTRKIS